MTTERTRMFHFKDEDFVGKRVRIIISPQGKITEVTAIDSLPRTKGPDGKEIGNPKNRFKELFWELITRPIKINDQWTEEKIATMRNDQWEDATITKSQLTYHVGMEEMNGLECVKIKVDREYERTGETEFKERSMKLISKHEGESSNIFCFACKEGIFVKNEGSHFEEGTTAYSGAYSATMPMSSESKQCVRSIKCVRK